MSEYEFNIWSGKDKAADCIELPSFSSSYDAESYLHALVAYDGRKRRVYSCDICNGYHVEPDAEGITIEQQRAKRYVERKAAQITAQPKRSKTKTKASKVGYYAAKRATDMAEVLKALSDGSLTCWLCGNPVTILPDGAGNSHPLMFTKDHVIPRSRGGSGGEKKPAHYICNVLRGPQNVTEDLRDACKRRYQLLIDGK